MNRYHLRRSALFTVILLLLLAGGAGVWFRHQRRQYALNRQLITALVEGNDKWAFALVNAGADPNTQYVTTPVPSMPVLVRQLFHRSPPPPNYTPTALLIACGTPWNDNNDTAFHAQQNRPDASQLVAAMLQHGAKVNVYDLHNATSLEYASSLHRYETVKVLVEHGADVSSVLYDAVVAQNIEIVRFLIKHGANVNIQDLAGQTPLRLAQRAKRPDIVVLLKQAGARK